jgi:hypothetical protein
MKNISSTGSFINFYLNNYIYVDKTKYIRDLIKLERVFISRPRRFGKSLTLDTIATLFETGVEPYFKGTWIYDKWTEPTYPVLRLNFLDLDKYSLEHFKQKLNAIISSFARDINVKNYEEKVEPEDTIYFLLDELRKEKRQIVILIDEYDCQMTANINNETLYKQFQEKIKSFYATIKNKWPIKFLGITGVTRLKDVEIFSIGSDIRDITNASAYSQMIGFTRDEIKRYYIDYLKLAASCENKCRVEEVTDAQIESMLDMMAQNYDGYCFDEFYKKKVFSTWSVNSFFQSIIENKFVDFGEYWYDNGGLPSILVNYLKTHKLNSLDYVEKDKTITIRVNDFKNPTSLTSINQNVLMCQTGYLTLRSPVYSKGFMTLGIPNSEVYNALLSLMALNIFDDTKLENVNEQILSQSKDVGEIIELFNTVLNTVSYDNYPISSEAVVKQLLYMYLKGICNSVSAELHSSKGRADLVIESDNRRIVFEFKYAKNEIEAKVKLSEAIEQIKTRDYGNIVPKKAELLRIAAVFNADPKVRAFNEYHEV